MESASCTPRLPARALLALILIAAGVGCRRPRTPPPPALPATPLTVDLRGRAIDQADHPIPDARVVAVGAAETRTDLDGRFALTGLRPGPYRLLVEAAGFATFETGVLTAPA